MAKKPTNKQPIIERKWCMPNKWTFTIKPIKDLLEQEIQGCGDWIDPFAGMNSPAQIRNDLNPGMNAQYHEDALKFLKMWQADSMAGALFDPPYSPRQVMECYQGIGMRTVAENTKMSFWSQCKDEKVICFGWNSMGLGKARGFKMSRILLVPHGASKNDTIVTVEKKIQDNLYNGCKTKKENFYTGAYNEI